LTGSAYFSFITQKNLKGSYSAEVLASVSQEL